MWGFKHWCKHWRATHFKMLNIELNISLLSCERSGCLIQSVFLQRIHDFKHWCKHSPLSIYKRTTWNIDFFQIRRWISNRQKNLGCGCSKHLVKHLWKHCFCICLLLDVWSRCFKHWKKTKCLNECLESMFGSNFIGECLHRCLTQCYTQCLMETGCCCRCSRWMFGHFSMFTWMFI